MVFGNKLADYLRQGADTLINLPTEAQRFLTNPQAFTELVTGKNPLPKETGFVAGASGLPPKNPVQGGVLNPASAPYQEGYEQGEPVAIASMAIPAYASALRAGAPKVADAIGNYMVKTGGIQPMFIGPESKLWDSKSAFEAAKMLKNDVPANEVWSKTGTSKGLENEFRQELSDANAVLKQLPPKPLEMNWETFFDKAEKEKYGNRGPSIGTMTSKELGKYRDFRLEQQDIFNNANNKTVKDIIDHPELFEAYPHLTEIKVQSMPANSGFRGDLTNNGTLIRLNETLTPDEARSVMLHELQHSIQGKENWARGGTSGEFPTAETIENAKFIQDLIDSGKSFADAGKIFQEKFGKRAGMEAMGLASNKKAYEISPNQYENYRNLAGEAEARLTQAREKLTPQERLNAYPFEQRQSTGLDINPEQAIISKPYANYITRKQMLERLIDQQK
jgi:hypothetical protein